MTNIRYAYEPGLYDSIQWIIFILQAYMIFVIFLHRQDFGLIFAPHKSTWNATKWVIHQSMLFRSIMHTKIKCCNAVATLRAEQGPYEPSKHNCPIAMHCRGNYACNYALQLCIAMAKLGKHGCWPWSSDSSCPPNLARYLVKLCVFFRYHTFW